jgi:hypothetical protein
MRGIQLRTIRRIFVLSTLMSLTLQTSTVLVTRDSGLLLAQNRGQWNGGDRYYELGVQAGRQDARRNLSSNYRRYRREFTPRWEAEFRQGYENGYENRFGSRGNSPYGYRSDGYRNDSRPYSYGNGPYGYASAGSMVWRGHVDHYVELRIQGDRVQSRERQGAQTLNEGASFTSPLPRADSQVLVRKRAGRGRVDLVQQPSRSNGYTAVIAISDESGGADDYELEMAWR